MRTKLALAFVLALLLVYVWLVIDRALLLLADSDLVARVIGLLLLVFPLLAAVIVVLELRFGYNTEQLRSRATKIGIPELSLEYRPSGRPTRESAMREFERIQGELESTPKSWSLWLRLAEAYRANGDGVRARRAARNAIRLARASDSQQE